MYLLHFVKTIVLVRYQTRCLNMLVRHHSVPCSAYLEIYFKREDSRILYEDLHEKLTKKRVSIYACICAILHVLLYACILLLHLFCNYFRFCVDVVMDVATSWCCSENLFLSVFFLCTCFLLMCYRIMDHVSMCVF